MKRYLAMVFVYGLICGLNLNAGEVDGKRFPILHCAKITMQTQRVWTKGTRLWVAVVIKNNRPGQIRGPILEHSPFWFFGYHCELHNMKTNKESVVHQYSVLRKRGLIHGTGGRRFPSFKINSQGSLRLLFVIPWPDKKNIRPNSYKLRLVIYHEIYGLNQVTSQIQIKAPTKDESLILKKLNFSGGGWTSVKNNTLKVRLPESLKKNSGLGFELFLTHLITQHKTVAEVNEKEFPNDLPAFFTPEINVLRYEVLCAKKQKKKAEELRKKLLAKHPGIKFRLDNIDNGDGPLKKLIKRQKERNKNNKEKSK